MSVDFKKSQTKENLMKAFIGESQARNRYTFAASSAKRENLHVVEAVFNFTANQEKEHAKIFYNYLKDLTGETIVVDGSYPVDTYTDMQKLLRAAQHNEYEEHNIIYKKFGDIATKEGFNNIASSFYKIAEIEKTHGDRFGRFAELIEQKKLFVSNIKTCWVCLNCGHIYTGNEAPQVCPVCKHNQGFFIRLSLYPFWNIQKM